ncbi:hypothetical protein I79_023500 [Cricetulus griseus]|uniref:Uncharacterized protein n=1 Tax=Cricetulus griseus TaxID=10029 RepID=G3II39_CRIGR|nr:hypothetical protein I79_023500 [Cricetulus griseus]
MWKTVCLSKGWFRYSESHRLHSAAPLWLSSDYRVDVMRGKGFLDLCTPMKARYTS